MMWSNGVSRHEQGCLYIFNSFGFRAETGRTRTPVDDTPVFCGVDHLAVVMSCETLKYHHCSENAVGESSHSLGYCHVDPVEIMLGHEKVFPSDRGKLCMNPKSSTSLPTPALETSRTFESQGYCILTVQFCLIERYHVPAFHFEVSNIDSIHHLLISWSINFPAASIIGQPA